MSGGALGSAAGSAIRRGPTAGSVMASTFLLAGSQALGILLEPTGVKRGTFADFTVNHERLSIRRRVSCLEVKDRVLRRLPEVTIDDKPPEAEFVQSGLKPHGVRKAMFPCFESKSFASRVVLSRYSGKDGCLMAQTA